jgi:hypothetical protein
MTANVVTGEGEASDGNHVVVLVARGGVWLPLSERITGPRQRRTPGQEAGNPARRCPGSLPHREPGPSRRFGTDGLDDPATAHPSAHRY